MAKIKLTKNELKRQKDALKRFLRYLPTLVLKKQQLQMEIRKVEVQQVAKRRAREEAYRQLEQWIALFGEELGLADLINVDRLTVTAGNIAGVDIPQYRGIEYREEPYDLFATPLWADAAVAKLRELSGLDAEVEVLDRQIRLLGEELRITSQRVNLFEKVKIPETREHIRRIQIYLGDEQTAAVVRGKIAKGKLERDSA
jgi:V/A-type H+-transporting ATPase subunit D